MVFPVQDSYYVEPLGSTPMEEEAVLGRERSQAVKQVWNLQLTPRDSCGSEKALLFRVKSK